MVLTRYTRQHFSFSTPKGQGLLLLVSIPPEIDNLLYAIHASLGPN